MAKLLAKLNKNHYEAMRLRLEGLSYREIGEQLGKSEKTIAQWFGTDDLFKEEFGRLHEETVERARAILVNYAPEGAFNLVKMARGEFKGKGSRIQLEANIDILDRVGLKAPDKQQIEHSGPEGGPVQVEYVAEWGGEEDPT